MTRQILRVLVLAVPISLLTPSLFADKWEQSTPYYEDDAWYDVSEWLDGNDYNPTDEVFGRRDDETYDWNVANDDQDNDRGGYGYDQSNPNDNWYYDYENNRQFSHFGRQDQGGLYDYSCTYYDFDGDDFYDAVYSSVDSDADNRMDQFAYFSFNTSAQDQQATGSNQQPRQQQKQQQANSKEQRVSGTIEQTKQVKVRNAPDRLVAQISTDQGNKIVVDLGPAKSFGKQSEHAGSDQRQNRQQQTGSQQQIQQAQQSARQGDQQSKSLQQGDRLEAQGPMLKVGDKQVLVAQSARIGNQQEQSIDRSGRQIQGQISQLKKAKVRGQEQQLAILKLQSGQQGLVDLGPADKLDIDLSPNDRFQVTGVPSPRSIRLISEFGHEGRQTGENRAQGTKAGRSVFELKRTAPGRKVAECRN